MRGAIPPLPNTSLWRGAYISTGTNVPSFTFYQLHNTMAYIPQAAKSLRIEDTKITTGERSSLRYALPSDLTKLTNSMGRNPS